MKRFRNMLQLIGEESRTPEQKIALARRINENYDKITKSLETYNGYLTEENYYMFIEAIKGRPLTSEESKEISDIATEHFNQDLYDEDN